MENFNESKKQNTKKNTRLAILLILILVIVFILISFIVIDYVSGPIIEKSENTYTVKGIGNKYKSNDKYWTLEVGEDIPEGYYNIKKVSSNPDETVNVDFIGSDELMEEAYDKNFNISLRQAFYLKDEEIDNIYIPEGTSVRLESTKPQDLIFKKLENPNKVDLTNEKKLGMYKTSLEKLTIPLVVKGSDLEVINNIEIHSVSDDYEIIYECYRDTCDYDKINRQTDEGESKEIILENELGKDAKNVTINLLDNTYIIVK